MFTSVQKRSCLDVFPSRTDNRLFMERSRIRDIQPPFLELNVFLSASRIPRTCWQNSTEEYLMSGKEMKMDSEVIKMVWNTSGKTEHLYQYQNISTDYLVKILSFILGMNQLRSYLNHGTCKTGPCSDTALFYIKVPFQRLECELEVWRINISNMK